MSLCPTVICCQPTDCRRGCCNLRSPPSAPLPCRLLVAVADSIAELAPEASHMLSSPSSGPPPPALLRQLEAGCCAILGCSLLAGALHDLSATAASKIGEACSLVFGPCAALLEQLLRGAQAGAFEASSVALFPICARHLQAVAPAVEGTLLSRRPKAAGAFAKSTGKPSTLLPWLRTVSQALTFAGAGAYAQSGKQGLGSRLCLHVWHSHARLETDCCALCCVLCRRGANTLQHVPLAAR